MSNPHALPEPPPQFPPPTFPRVHPRSKLTAMTASLLSGRPTRPVLLMASMLLLLAVLAHMSLPSSHAHVRQPEGRLHDVRVPQEQVPGALNLGGRADFDEMPAFCKSLIANPLPYESAKCVRDNQNTSDLSCGPTSTEGHAGKYEMFSQFKQDHYIYTRHFRHLKRRGVYFDVAANEPVQISNTYFMDRCLRWSGVCVEGNPGYLTKLLRDRSCHIVPTCVMDRDDIKVNFLLAGGTGGVQDASHKYMEQWAASGRKVETITLKCTTMHKIVQRAGLKVVDYMSLDVEGAELKVLHGFDWDAIRINVISVETSKDTFAPLEEFILSKGYKRHLPVDLDEYKEGKGWTAKGLISEDAIFLHESVEFGRPV